LDDVISAGHVVEMDSCTDELEENGSVSTDANSDSNGYYTDVDGSVEHVVSVAGYGSSTAADSDALEDAESTSSGERLDGATDVSTDVRMATSGVK